MCLAQGPQRSNAGDARVKHSTMNCGIALINNIIHVIGKSVFCT